MALVRSALTCLAAPLVLARANGLRGAAPNQTQNATEQTVASLLAEFSLDLSSVEGEAPWNSSFLSDLAALLGNLPSRGSGSLLDSEPIPVVPAPWSSGSAVDDASGADGVFNGSSSMQSLSQFSSWESCSHWGCVNYNPVHRCQCNSECAQQGNCCSDYHDKCSTSGGGHIVATKAWVALVAGQSDDGFHKWLCGVVRHYTNGPICHNGIIFEGSVAGRSGYFFLEYGNSGFEDVLTGKNRWGLLISSAAERFQGKQVLVRRIYGDLSQLSAVVQEIRGVPYFLSAAAIARLVHRSNTRFSEHLMCSDFVAKVLVGIGCLHADAGAFNAYPTDFSSHAVAHSLHYTCHAEPDTYFDSRHR